MGCDVKWFETGAGTSLSGTLYNSSRLLHSHNARFHASEQGAWFEEDLGGSEPISCTGQVEEERTSTAIDCVLELGYRR